MKRRSSGVKTIKSDYEILDNLTSSYIVGETIDSTDDIDDL